MSGFVLASLIFMVFLLACAPSKDNMLIVAQTLLNGPRRGLFITLGVVVGLWLYATLASLSVGLALFTEPDLLVWFKVIAIVYLMYLAFGMMNSRSERLDDAEVMHNEHQAFQGGVQMILARPSIGLFFAAFFTLFLQAREGLWPISVQLFVFVLLFVTIVFVVYFGLILLAHVLGPGPFSPVRAKTVQRTLYKMKPVAFLLLGLVFGLTQLL